MIYLGPANENDMVLAFLRAEKDSNNESLSLRLLLTMSPNLNNYLNSGADLTNMRQNQTRKEMLGYRGYGHNEALFRGFPDNVEWYWVDLELVDLYGLRYLNCTPWDRLSERTCIVCIGAKNVDNELLRIPEQEVIKAISRDVGIKIFQRSIIVQDTSSENQNLLILEGSKRATAYVYVTKQTLTRCIIGKSDKMSEWYFY